MISQQSLDPTEASQNILQEHGLNLGVAMHLKQRT
jgi:hypothetical protein